MDTLRTPVQSALNRLTKCIGFPPGKARQTARLTALTALLIGLQGCGTFNTVPYSNKQIAKDLKARHTRCESIPRIYSGVGYNLCVLNADGSTTAVDKEGFDLWLIDTPLTFVTDTIMLPVSSYQQYRLGSVQIN